MELRGVEVHNLQQVDLDIPHRRLVVMCGVSGSGKTSLAIDTLYAEGQRRYIESFSPQARQFLEQIEKPAAKRIDGIAPAVAVTRRGASRSNRVTVATATEIADYLRLMFARIGVITCPECDLEVRRDTADSAAAGIAALPPGTRLLVGFTRTLEEKTSRAETLAELREEGYVRVVLDGATHNLADAPLAALPLPADGRVHVVVDRLTSETQPARVRETLETALGGGAGEAFVWHEPLAEAEEETTITLDGRSFTIRLLSDSLRCRRCGREFAEPTPKLLSYNSPLGACPMCEGFGNLLDIDMELVVPDTAKTLRDGAIAPWTTPAYAHELKELLALAADYEIPVDIPYRDLEPRHLDLIREGVPEREFGGLNGFFAWLERRKYKMHIRAFLSRWRSESPCPACHGNRLRPEALAVRLGGVNIAEICRASVGEARRWLSELQLGEAERRIARVMLEQVGGRLRFLGEVGLDYLTLDRPLRSLSGGEGQRVNLATALGSSLVNMLYVLDEPSAGLHAADVERLLASIRGLRDRGNSVVVVEHEESFLRAADEVIEIGPGAGREGGRVVYQGPPGEIEQARTLTGDYLARRRGSSRPERRRPPRGAVRIAGARGNNLQDITVEFPLGVLCVVTGVSGSGKSTLVQETLYPAMCRRLRKEGPKPAPYTDVFGDGQIDDIILVDQSPIGRSPRSNPVTYIKAFDEIRNVFAETLEARTRNYQASWFSFNVDGGRCTTCSGDGVLTVDMQFLADVYMRCPQCRGTRYRPEILKVTYRGRNIAEVLEMTVREAFGFFRGQKKVQTRLKRLLDVGLEYLQLGQSASTLSAGEAQRLKLAGYLAGAGRSRTLFLLDEPTTGLHFADVVQLLDCFDALLSVGHSLIENEHNMQLIRWADYVIDLGPGPAERGGRVVARGTPEQLAADPTSLTGRYLQEALAQTLPPEEDGEDDEPDEETAMGEEE